MHDQSTIWPWLSYIVLVTQPCPFLCDPVDCSPPGFSVHGILPPRILEWLAIPFSRASSRPRDRTCVSHIAGRFFSIWATKFCTSPPEPVKQDGSQHLPHSKNVCEALQRVSDKYYALNIIIVSVTTKYINKEIGSQRGQVTRPWSHSKREQPCQPSTQAEADFQTGALPICLLTSQVTPAL